MRFYELNEDGRIVKGVNTTVDVGPNEIPKQAKKFGNSVDKDGRPPTLSKKVKGKSTNVLFNLGLAETISVDTLYENVLYYRQMKENLGEIAQATEIYIDMDGVLADFFGEWAKLMDKKHWTKIDDFPDALQKIRDTEQFWLELPILPQAKQLLALIKQVKGEYNICSTPLADDPKSEPHKLEWIKKNLAFFPPKKIHITHDKPQYATQQDGTPNILIDDYGKNVEAWEAAGGIGFKYKDHKFERTAKDIKQHMQEPVEENFADGKKKVQPTNEAFDNPYPITWEYLKPTGPSSAIGKVEDGSALDIHISEDPDGIYEIEFARGQSDKNMGRSGQGDEFRIFATVQTAMIEWWNQLDKASVKKITFYANKEDGNRSRLYKRFLKIWGDKSEWDIEVNGNVKPGLLAYSLTNPNPDEPKNDRKTFMQRIFGKKETVENFADGKKKGKSRPGRVKRSGASCNGSVTSLRKKAKKASGEKAKMYHWCANMKSGRA